MIPSEHEYERAPELEPGARLLRGRYTIEHRLEQGGAATVYAARTTEGLPVALKILNPEHMGRPDLVERMNNEMRVGAGLHDVPNLVRPIDHGTVPELRGRPFIAFELIEAPDIEFVLISGPLPPLRACMIARELADTLAHLHTRGVVHRDVKPSNVLLAQASPGLRVWLLDLGFAFSAGTHALPNTSGVTQDHRLPGTPEFMAPEQALGEPAAPSFDIYALAATLFTMLVRRPPYYGHKPLEIIRRLRDPNLPSPSIAQAFVDLDPALSRLVDAGLAKDPARRIASAAEFRARLDAIILALGGPVATGPSPTQERAPWIRPLLAATVLLVGAGTIAGLSVAPRALEALPLSGVQPRRTVAGADPQPVALSNVVATERPPTAVQPRPESPVLPDPPPKHADPRVPDDRASPEATTALEPAPRIRQPTPTARASTAPHRRSEPAPAPEPACDAVLADAERAKRGQAWTKVVDLTEKHRDCWQDASARTLLRVLAFRGQQRFDRCLTEGTGDASREVQRIVAYCTTKELP